MGKVNITAKIAGITYTPFLCSKLKTFEFKEFKNAFQIGSFILRYNANNFAISWWVSPKRTRSYPYARIYDTLNFSGKRVTIIPIVKDEGFDGDRDYLQWDTISLMSLLGIYVIISYYKIARKNENYDNKITNQEFDISYVKSEIRKLSSYQSDALHWNLKQIDNIKKLAKKALDNYNRISKVLDVRMHSENYFLRRIDEIAKGREKFMEFSRELSHQAQERERMTVQPKEKISGIKATITIKNYLGGLYQLTCDEIYTVKNDIFLVEAKHTKRNSLPSIGDIKDGLLKMLLFTNLENVSIDRKQYNSHPVLKLTSNSDKIEFSKRQRHLLSLLIKEADENNFLIEYNGKIIEDI